MTTLTRSAAKGGAQTLIGQGVRALVQLAALFVLSRLLEPADFGLYAMVTVIVGFGELLRDMGLTNAAIQADDLTDDERSSLTWANLGIGTVLAVIVAAASPLIAAFYGEPRLTAVAAVVGLTFIVNGFAAQYRASHLRALNFARTAIADSASPLVGLAAGTAAALAGLGYWSLVVQEIARAVSAALIVIVRAGWAPSPRRRASIRRFVSYGGFVMATQTTTYISKNVDVVALGRTAGAVATGYYSRAFQVAALPVYQLSVPIMRVALPVLSRVKRDHGQYDSLVRGGQKALLYSVGTIIAVLAMCAAPLTGLVLGPQWGAAAPLIAILALGSLFEVAASVVNWIFLSLGYTSLQFRYNLLARAIVVVLVLVGVPWGPVGVAIGFAAGNLVIWPLAYLWIRGLEEVRSLELLKESVRIVAVLVTSALLGWLAIRAAEHWMGTVADVVLLLGALVVFLLAAALWWVLSSAVKADVRDLLRTVKLLAKEKA